MLTTRHAQLYFRLRANDSSAGSPTEILLRLLLPESQLVRVTVHGNAQETNIAAVQDFHQNTQSVAATSGVYKDKNVISTR